MKNYVRCNNCMNIFLEYYIICDKDTDEEYCPYCGKSGWLMDLTTEEVRKYTENSPTEQQ